MTATKDGDGENNNKKRKRANKRKTGRNGREEEPLRIKILRGLERMRTLQQVMTYEEFGIAIGYIPLRLNRILRQELAKDLAANMRMLRKTDDAARYEMCFIPGMEGTYIVPYRLSQELIEQRIGHRVVQAIGTTRSVDRSIDLLKLEAKENQKYNKKEANQVADTLRERLHDE